MKIILSLLLCSLTAFYVVDVHAQEGLYLDVGLSVHLRDIDKPEFDSVNPLGNIGGGYSFEWEENKYIEVYVRHTSSLLDVEKGYGLNQMGVQIRIYQ